MIIPPTTTAKKIIVKGLEEKRTYELISYQRSNNETCYNQRPIVHKGDKVQCVVHYDTDEILSVNLIDYYRLNGEFFLALAFALFLIIFNNFSRNIDIA